ncbi:MAG TPA: hypothetical protein VL284_16575 [Thermoanaerobaculia bacterium]|nr:hypothetical protein [Thermoanaerobaculia bacterium]
MRLIGTWSHLIIDVAIVILLVFGPAYAGFAGRQADLAWVLAGALGLLVAFTFVKAIRFVVHGVIEIVLIAIVLAMPWLAGFARGVHSRNFYLFAGVVMLAIWLMTDFRRLRSSARKQPTV